MHWFDSALCKGLTHIFFAKDSERPQATVRREAIAQSVCNQCEVFEQCRTYARTHGEIGYWAGENEYDRYLLGFMPKGGFGPITRSVSAYAKRKQQLLKKGITTS